MPVKRMIQTLEGWDVFDEFFSGTMLYRATFDMVQELQGEGIELSLGDVREVARVRLNGRDLGCRFVPPYRFEVPEDVLTHENELEVEVTNLGANRIRWNDQNGVEWKRFHDINIISVKGVWAGGCVPFDASDWPLRDSGLLGPVLIELK